MFFLYLTLWLIFSMRLNLEVAVAGFIVSTAVYIFACHHMRYKPATDLKILRNLLLGLRYVLILILETAKANIAVFRIIFKRVIVVEPQLVYFRTNLRTNIARVALANSITLTPGTITVALNDGLFCVYCLNSKIAEDLKDSVFVRQLKKLEGRGD